MARSFVRVDVSGAVSKINRLDRSVRLATQDMQMEVAEAGAAKMREYVQTRGTGRTWTRPWLAKESPASGSPRTSSSPGRVNTGKMLKAIRARFERGAQRTIAAFGWIDEKEPYFYAQEYGFSAGGFRPPMPVQGMFALRDARLFAVNFTKRIAKKYQNRIARGKY